MNDIPQKATLPADPAAVDLSSIDPTAVDELEFASLVRTAPDDMLEAALATGRELILDEIFRRMGEHFEPERAAGVEALIEWQIGGAPEGAADRYFLTISDGACTIAKEADRPPRATLSISAVDFIRVATGNALGPALYMAGRILIDGDIELAMTVPTFFRIPEPAAGAAGGTTAQS